MMPDHYERLSERLLKDIPRPKPFVKFNPATKRVDVGTQSSHRHPKARMWRTVLRMMRRTKP